MINFILLFFLAAEPLQKSPPDIKSNATKIDAHIKYQYKMEPNCANRKRYLESTYSSEKNAIKVFKETFPQCAK